jgi:hypothetical protein
LVQPLRLDKSKKKKQLANESLKTKKEITMKKTLSLLALAATLTSFSAFADDSNGGMVYVTNNTYSAVKVTIFDGTEIKDQGCLMPFMTRASADYKSQEYRVQVEVKEGHNCNSQTTNEMEQPFRGNDSERNINIENNYINIR